MESATLAAFDRFCVKIGAKSWETNHKALWKFYRAWDYAQANDSVIWEDDTDIEGLIEAETLSKRDQNAGFRQFLALAEAGSVWAMDKVGHCYHSGRGVAADAALAEHWYRLSFDAGCTRALLDLGAVLASRGDFAGAEAVYGRGAADDWPPALFWLAVYQMKQSDSRATLDRARPLLERAMAKGSPAAQWVLGWLLLRGRFGLRDIPRGFKLYCSATTPLK